MVVEAAERRGIPWAYRKDLDLLQLGHGSGRRWIRAMTTCLESDLSVDLAQDKYVTKMLLKAGGIPVPAGCVVRSEEAARNALTKIRSPVVVKPLDGHKGNGVSVGLKTADEIIEAYRQAARYSRAVLLEEQLPGRDFRVLVVNGKVFAAAERIPANVTGDGIHTISELVAIENENPARGVGREKSMTRIRLDRVATSYIASGGHNLNNIPASGTTVFLRGNANLSQGGCCDDITDELHPDVRNLCERAARIIGLPLCGIDLILENATSSPWGQKGGIIEINAGPGIRVHHYPRHGKARDAGAAILEYLYPGREDGRIPCFGVYGSAAVAHGIALELAKSGLRVGSANETEVIVDSVRLASLEKADPISLVLGDPAVDAAVFDSLSPVIHPFLELSVAVVNNTESSIAEIAARLTPSGKLLVNADCDPLLKVLGSSKLSAQRLVLFSTNSHSCQEHVNQGGTAYFRKNGQLLETIGLGQQSVICDLPEHSSPEPSNHIAVIAACRISAIQQKTLRAF